MEIDSPTVTNTALQTLLAIAVLKKWHCKTTDINAAFLQSSQIKRPIHLIPPTEFRKENNTWKLNEPVYGLNNAA